MTLICVLSAIFQLYRNVILDRRNQACDSGQSKVVVSPTRILTVSSTLPYHNGTYTPTSPRLPARSCTEDRPLSAPAHIMSLEESQSWEPSCSLRSLFTMSCKSKAEAFAKKLQCRLRTLGSSSDQDGEGQESSELVENGDSRDTYDSMGNHSWDTSPAGVVTSAVKKTDTSALFRNHSDSEVTYHLNGDTVTVQVKHGAANDSDMYFDFDIESPESPTDRKSQLHLHINPIDNLVEGDGAVVAESAPNTQSTETGEHGPESGCVFSSPGSVLSPEDYHPVYFRLGSIDAGITPEDHFPPSQFTPEEPFPQSQLDDSGMVDARYSGDMNDDSTDGPDVASTAARDFHSRVEVSLVKSESQDSDVLCVTQYSPQESGQVIVAKQTSDAESDISDYITSESEVSGIEGDVESELDRESAPSQFSLESPSVDVVTTLDNEVFTQHDGASNVDEQQICAADLEEGRQCANSDHLTFEPCPSVPKEDEGEGEESAVGEVNIVEEQDNDGGYEMFALELEPESLENEPVTDMELLQKELEQVSIEQKKAEAENEEEEKVQSPTLKITPSEDVGVPEPCPKEPPDKDHLSPNDSPVHKTKRSSDDDDDDQEPITPRLQRSSSLKTGKTPPGTPGRKKIVRFADRLGLDLADVRTFLDEIPNVPHSAYQDLEVAEDFRRSSAAAQQEAARPAPFFNPFPDRNQPFNHPPTRKTLVPMFSQPGGFPDFFDRVRDQKVVLENAYMADDMTITGTVRVLNMDFHKSVHIRYTLNEWRSFTDLQCSYVQGSCDGFSDKFSFDICAHSLQVGERLRFSVRYHAQGQQFWDSNNDQNYVFQCFSTGSAAAVVSPTSYGTSLHMPSDPWMRHFY